MGFVKGGVQIRNEVGAKEFCALLVIGIPRRAEKGCALLAFARREGYLAFLFSILEGPDPPRLPRV